jgi:hypothetical protein
VEDCSHAVRPGLPEVDGAGRRCPRRVPKTAIVVEPLPKIIVGGRAGVAGQRR